MRWLAFLSASWELKSRCSFNFYFFSDYFWSDALLTQSPEAQGIVAFGQTDASRVSDERAVIKGWRRTAKGAIKQQLSRG
jgi:hypothetical protein